MLDMLVEAFLRLLLSVIHQIISFLRVREGVRRALIGIPVCSCIAHLLVRQSSP